MQCEFVEPRNDVRCARMALDFCEVIPREGDRKVRWMWLCLRHLRRYRLIYCWPVETTVERAVREAAA